MRLQPKMQRQHQGTALVIGLVLLVVATILAVVGMQSSTFQERMASNQHNKAISFMAAEMGGAYLVEELARMGFVADLDPQAFPFPVGSDQEPLEAGGFGYFYISAMQVVTGDPDLGLPDSLTASIIGVSRENINGDDLAQTELEVSIESFLILAGGGTSDAAINLVGDVDEFVMPNSNSLTVYGTAGEDGTYGPAVGTLKGSDAAAIETELASKGNVDGECPNGPRLCNYHGGITAGNFHEFWQTPDEIWNFVDATCAQAGSADGRNTTGLVANTNDTVRCGSDVPGNTIARGRPSDRAEAMRMKTTVVTGDANMNFSGGQTGAGLLVVTGDLYANGNPSWDGIIIVLGGVYDVKGGGNGILDGTIYVLNLDPSNDRVTWSTAGGGTATYNHNCDKIEAALDTLGTYDPEDDPPSTARNIFGDAHGCEPVGGLGPGAAPDPRREYRVQRWVEVLRGGNPG